LQQACYVQQHLIPFQITVVIVEGFEVIQIDVADDKGSALTQEPVQIVRDGNIAGQKGQRIAMRRRAYFFLGDALE
jgi:hypothetical protein